MDELYLELTNPQVLRPKIENFSEWLDLGTLEDLECTLKAFELEEMFEDCVLIKNKIDLWKQDLNKTKTNHLV